METAALIISALSLVCVVILLLKRPRQTGGQTNELAGMLTANQKAIGDMQSQRMSEMSRTIQEMNERLDKRLEAVHKSMGEMQDMAKSVGDLKKIFSNVKSRGILGEMQLGSILSDILAPEQYTENIATIPGSRETVEFAIRMPGTDGALTYMPIDSKFPADTYSALLDAKESGIKPDIEAASRQLRQRLLAEARDIHEKYVFPPYTTDFAIMFLPSEGLYAEAVGQNMIEEMQNKYKIMLAGPSTMAAMLSSIRMGFRTLAVEKRSAEVWEVLGAVKTEFEKFNDILESARKRINQADAEMDKLIGTRTRAIMRKLRSVEQLEDSDMDFEEG